VVAPRRNESGSSLKAVTDGGTYLMSRPDFCVRADFGRQSGSALGVGLSLNGDLVGTIADVGLIVLGASCLS